MTEQVAVEDDFFADSATGAADETGIITIQSDKARCDPKHGNIREFTAGFDNAFVIGDERGFVYDDYAAFCIALSNVDENHTHFLCCEQ